MVTSKLFKILAWFFPACIFIGLMASCQGPTGPNGSNALLTDSLPPQIEWISPDPGVTVDSSLVLSVAATDNAGVYRVSFFIAGFEVPAELTDTTAGIYNYEWVSVTYPEGPYPLMARVWDDARQVGTTPVIVVEVRH